MRAPESDSAASYSVASLLSGYTSQNPRFFCPRPILRAGPANKRADANRTSDVRKACDLMPYVGNYVCGIRSQAFRMSYHHKIGFFIRRPCTEYIPPTLLRVRLALSAQSLDSQRLSGASRVMCFWAAFDAAKKQAGHSMFCRGRWGASRSWAAATLPTLLFVVSPLKRQKTPSAFHP